MKEELYHSCNWKMKAMWKRRISVMEAIYADLITEGMNRGDFNFLNHEWVDFENQVFSEYLQNKRNYVDLINKFLKKGWDFERINLAMSSILLGAISEFNVLNTPKNVLISQSVKTAKNYCGDSEFKMVNGLLENLFRDK